MKGKVRINFKAPNVQREFLNTLFMKLELVELSDWLQISRYKIICNGGEALLSRYQNDLKKTLSTLYPNYPWKFEYLKNHISTATYKSLETQRQHMNKIFSLLNLSSLEDFLVIPKQKIEKSGGNRLMRIYNCDLPLLLTTLYPNFPWSSFSARRRQKAMRSIAIQREVMNEVIKKLKVKNFSELNSITKQRIAKSGAEALLRNYYGYDIENLLRTIYPNYTWHFDANHRLKVKRFRDLRPITKQRWMMEMLFAKLKLETLDEWTKISARKMGRKGAKRLLRLYNGNKRALLINIYPNYPWREVENKVWREEVRKFMEIYNVERKKDWYRVPMMVNKLPIILRTLFPTERWKNREFCHKNKKCSQRVLYIGMKYVCGSHHSTLENYRHPILTVRSPLEYDIFIPGLNLAMEYQGQQHFDDIPSFFNSPPAYLEIDATKVALSKIGGITLIPIPYWWDFSVSSLYSSVYPIMMFQLKVK